MKIRVKLISLPGPPPPGFDEDGNGTLEAVQGSTLGDLLERLKLPGNETYVTLINGEPVSRDRRSERTVRDGDTLTIFPPIEGG